MNKRVHGSFTIEAVFVVPIVLFTIVSIIYISFYLHDYNRMRGMTDRTLHRASFYVKHEFDIEKGKIHYEEIKDQGIICQVFDKSSDTNEDEIETYLMKKLSDGLFATRITDIEVKLDKLKTSIKVTGEFQIPIKGLSKVFFSNKALIIDVSASNHNPAEAVRISEVVLDTGSKIKGIDKLKEKIQTLLP